MMYAPVFPPEPSLTIRPNEYTGTPISLSQEEIAVGLWDDALGNITGRSVEQKVTEYSEIYGEILLGIHREIESHHKRIHDCNVREERLRGKVAELETLLESALRRLGLAVCLARSSFVISLLSIGVILWKIR